MSLRCIVTAGPSFEPLDQVRRLTNFSTGRLGSELAVYLAERGHAVTLWLGQQAAWPPPAAVKRVERFGTTDELRAGLQALAGESVDAVFHAAAVCDYRFARIWHQAETGELTELQGGKISTRSGKLLAELAPTVKVIAHLRSWFPRAWLVGWKYEVEGKRGDVLLLAKQQIQENRTNGCVANGPAYGAGFGFVLDAGEPVHVPDQRALFVLLERAIPRAGPRADR